MRGRPPTRETAPLTKPQQIVWLDEVTRNDVLSYMQANGSVNVAQTLAELIKLGLGMAPDAVAVQGTKVRVHRQLDSWMRSRVAQMLGELRTEVEQMSNDPAAWKGE